MKKKIVYIGISLIILSFLLFLLIPMVNYVITYTNMNSFMSLENAIICVVVLTCFVILNLFIIIYFIIQIAKHKF